VRKARLGPGERTHASSSFQRSLVLWPAATSSTSPRTSSRRWRPQTATPVYRGLIRMARTALLLQPAPLRCELRARS
jgi:hypothetical protein